MGVGSVVVMGVSGSGKSTIGVRLAARLGAAFNDGDDLHPPANLAKMAAGIPLTDADRAPWLDACGAWLAGQRAASVPAMLACSALKRSYRDRLRDFVPDVRFVYLAGDRDLLLERLGARRGHFFPTDLLDAQVADLEPPAADEHPVIVPITLSIDEIVAAAAAELADRPVH